MVERQPTQISVIDDTSSPKQQNEQDDGVDLENPPDRQRRINNNDDISELDNEQYADDDATTYTTYTSYITKRSYRYRWLTVAIVVITIIIIFLSRGAVGGGVNAKNQDVDNTVDSAVGSDRGGGGGGGGSTQVVKEVEKSEKSKKSKSGKW